MGVWGHLLLVESFASSLLHPRSLRVRAHKEPIGPVGRKLVFGTTTSLWRVVITSPSSLGGNILLAASTWKDQEVAIESKATLWWRKTWRLPPFTRCFWKAVHTQRPTSRSMFGAGKAFNTWFCPAEDEILEIKISDWPARMSTPVVEIFGPATSHPRRLESRAHITTYPGGGKVVYKSYHLGASWDTRPQHHRWQGEKDLE